MEIEDIRKELNHLLENVVEHSKNFSEGRPIPSLEIGVVLSKINKMQERLIVLRHLLEQQEINYKKHRALQKAAAKVETIQEDVIIATEIKEEKIEVTPPIAKVEADVPTAEATQPTTPEVKQSFTSKLADVLTLNDRYLYANELFNKDMNAFNEFVKSIDSSVNLNTAKELLFALNLDIDNEYVASFSELIDRRFS